MTGVAAILTILTLLPGAVQAVSFYTNTTAPKNLTSACSKTLVGDVACDPVVPALKPGDFYPNSTLTRACTTNCANALTSFQNSVNTACRGETWLGYDSEVMPVAIIPELMRYHYNLTCLKNGNQFCNNVAAAYAAFLDSKAASASPPAGGQYGGITVTDACDICLVKNLQFQAGSPYYDGPDLWSSSIYQQKTSSCKVTGASLTTTPLTIFTPTTPATPAPTCGGSTYSVKAGDTCHSISLSQGISTSWLLQDNHLATQCAGFPTNGTLCLVNKCKVYTVKANETCSGIASAQNITIAQFKAWNPSINAGCYNLDTMVGDQVCISQPGNAYVPPTTSITLAPSTPTEPAPVPTNIALDTNTYCGRFYEAIKGDFCNKLILKFGLSLSDFIFLNPAINENCTNLFALESYCVAAVGDINTYSGRPGFVSYTATLTGLVGDPATRWPVANYTTPTRVSTSRLPLATGTRSDCFNYFDGAFFKVNGTSRISDCQRAVNVLMVTLQDLQVWNPSLGNVSDSGCTFDNGLRYCGKYYIGDIPIPTEPTGGGSPIRDNTTTNCTIYVDVSTGSGFTCQNILTFYRITIAQFFQWNPSVGSDCGNLWLGYQYCVAGPGWVDTDPADGDGTSLPPATTTSAVPPGPTQTGQPSNCNKWYLVKSGDSCAAVEDQFFITSAQFLKWNPSVSADCSKGFLAGFAYCVGTTDIVSSTRSSPGITTTSRSTTTSSRSTSTSKPSTSVSTPGPIQTGVAKSCNKFAMAKGGDTCPGFASNNGITAAQLYTWNTVLGANGANCASSFWANEWYCVGVSG